MGGCCGGWWDKTDIGIYVLHRAPPLRLERLEFVFSGRVHMRTYFVDSVLG